MKKGFSLGKDHMFLNICFVIFLGFFLLNCFTPKITDDYTYSFIYLTDRRVEHMGDVIRSLYIHYHHWAGRTVIFFLLQTFLLIGKPIFNIVTGFVYVSYLILLLKLAGRRRFMKGEYLFLTAMAAWFFIPAYAETMLWMTGACNYLWVTVIVLLFLIPYRALWDGKNVGEGLKKQGLQLFFFFPGIIAGWCNETISGGCILGAAIFMAEYKLLQKKKLPAWTFVGLAGNVAGFGMMMAAPGNYIRAEGMGGNSLDLVTLESRWTGAVNMLYEHLLPLCMIFTFLYIVFFMTVENKKERCLPLLFLLLALACNFSMILSPYYPERSMFGCATFLIIGALTVYERTAALVDKKWRIAAFGSLLLLFLFTYYNALMDTAHTYVSNRRRESYIQEERDKGGRNIKVEEIKKKSVYNPWEDMKDKPDEWPNVDIGKYYGLDTIVIEEKGEYK